ncbi:MAG: sigma-70 family RNA polymerase sigma factor [Dehalococcoidia bacterium]|nr:sigma-70 family RNA polymerase sigma factor [Dehalococcoidia bacterium]
MSAAVLRWHNPGWAAAMPSRQPGHRIWPTAVRGTEYNSLRDRDHESWNVLFDQEAPAIYRYALSRLGDAGLAEEATSDVFEAAWKGAESFTDRGLPARAWLFGIARHVVASQQRRWRRRAPQISIDAYVESGQSESHDDRLDLVRAIAALTAAHAEVINLRFLQGLSLAETAQVLNITIDAVKGRQLRALEALRRELGEP